LACFIFLYFQPWKTCSHLKRKSFSLSSSLISELGGLMMKSFPENFQLCFVWTSSLINESFGKVIFQGRFHQPTVEQNKDIDFIFYRKFHNTWRNLYFKNFHECKTTFIKLKTYNIQYIFFNDYWCCKRTILILLLLMILSTVVCTPHVFFAWLKQG
jgi:hypothetical protein